ncbi:YPDG domain-containing protein, partial [Corynebacterium imitans]|uniref:YPDG domain-containing protein n=1 Tax=Corynebacterium imitans TaxID=156978 RepID=UPI001EF3877D
TKQNDEFEPGYEDGSGKPGEDVKVEKPEFKDKDGNPTEAPDGTKFTPGEDAPEGVDVDENTGEITVPVPEDAKPGDKITVPVEVTYPDGSKDTTEVTVTVGDPDAPEAPTPEVKPGDTTVPADDQDHTVGKVENPKGDETGNLVDKDGNQIPGSNVEIDKDGNIKVTVPEGTDPQDATVVVTDKDGNKVGEVDVKITKPKDNAPAPQPGPADTGKCIASAVGFGLPLLALIPIGLATQLTIPGLTDFVENVSMDIERANAQIQKNLGMFNPQTAQAMSQMNAQLRKAGLDLATVGAGLAVIAAGIIAGTIIYDNCAPGDAKSSVKVDSLKGSSGKIWTSSKKDQK